MKKLVRGLFKAMGFKGSVDFGDLNAWLVHSDKNEVTYSDFNKGVLHIRMTSDNFTRDIYDLIGLLEVGGLKDIVLYLDV